VLVLGGVSWEGKFVIAALEETGWQVDAALALRPGADVSQGLNARPDTARHAAVIVLDSVSDAAAARVAAYVRMGGGLVLAPAAWQAPAFRPLLAGRPGRIIASRPGLVEATPATLRVQTLTPVAHAVALASRGAEVVAAARRVGSGRVVQIGYDET
jgi:hypothetical protein